jgi:Rab-GTPase-TBC domain
MNFIVASLLYHANEVMAFWLFINLIESCEMRDIYTHGLPGLFKHSQIIDMLIQENLNDIFQHFVRAIADLLILFTSASTTLEWRCTPLTGYLGCLPQ